MKMRKVNESELRALLVNGVVTFQYIKNDGTVRTAKGTLKSDVLASNLKGGKSTVKDAGYISYFDLEKNAFRCFAPSRLVGVVEE